MATPSPHEAPEDFNPYRAPQSSLDRPPEPETGEWLGRGRVVPAKNGLLWIREAWRLLAARPGLWIPALLPVAALLCVETCTESEWLSTACLLCLTPLWGGASALAWRQMQGETGRWFDIFALCRGRLGQLLVLGLLALAIEWLPAVAGLPLGVIIALFDLPLAAAMTTLVAFQILCHLCAMLGLTCAPTLVTLARQNAWRAFWSSLSACLRNWRALLANGLTPFFLFLNMAPTLVFLVSLPLAANPEALLQEAEAWSYDAAINTVVVAGAVFAVLMDFVTTRDLFHNDPDTPNPSPQPEGKPDAPVPF